MLRLRRTMMATSVAAALTGCASDVVLKPAVATFDARAGAAIAAVDTQFTTLVVSFNDNTADWLADNPDCGFLTTLRVRTADADAWLRAHGSAQHFPRTGYCLSNAEADLLDHSNNAKLIEYENLFILGRRDFAAQLDTVNILSAYVSALAAAADTPRPDLKAQIAETATALTTLGSGVSALVAVARTGEADTSKTFAPGGPVATVASGIGNIAGSLQKIIAAEQDAKAIRAAVLGPQGATIAAQIRTLSTQVDLWNCAQFGIDRVAQMHVEQRFRTSLADQPFEQRAALYRQFIAANVPKPPVNCGVLAAPGAGPLPPQSSTARMLFALAATHDELSRIAHGNYTVDERRRMTNAALTRLGALFQAVAQTAVAIL